MYLVLKEVMKDLNEIVTHYQTTRFQQLETNCRRHFEVHLTRKNKCDIGRKHCEKKRKCLLQTTGNVRYIYSSIYISFTAPECPDGELLCNDQTTCVTPCSTSPSCPNGENLHKCGKFSYSLGTGGSLACVERNYGFTRNLSAKSGRKRVHAHRKIYSD